MSTPPQGAQSPQYIPGTMSSCSPSSVVYGDQLHRRRQRSGNPEFQLSNVIDVEDAARLMECAHIQRQQQFQQLVRRYISQILHGCRSASCTTPTCLSCNKRLVTRPFRVPTQLTARALAHFLASQDDPYRGLCPHPLKVTPDALQVEGLNHIEPLMGKGGFDGSHNMLSIMGQLSRLDAHTLPRSKASAYASTSSTSQAEREQHHMEEALTSLAERRQRKKDVKSLGQNLYDTITVIYSISMQVPSTLSMFAYLRSLKPLNPGDALRTRKPDTADRQEDKLSDDSKTQSVGHPAQTCVNEAALAVPFRLHNSQQHSSTAQKLSLVQSPDENLNHRQRRRRSKSRTHEPAWKGPIPQESTDCTTVDGTQDIVASQNTPSKTNPPLLNLIGTKHDPLGLLPLSVQREKNMTLKEPTIPVTSPLSCDILDELKEKVHHHRNEQPSKVPFIVDFEARCRYRPTTSFVNRSLFFTLSDPETLLTSFRETGNREFERSPLPHLNSTRLTHSFRDWNRKNGALIFDSLWNAAGILFTPPPELDIQKSPRLKASGKTSPVNGATEGNRSSKDPVSTANCYLSNEEVAHIVMICIHALTSAVPMGWPHTWVQLRRFRSWGIILPDAKPQEDFTDGFTDPWISIIDELEYEPALRLADRLVRGIGARLCFEKILKTLRRRENRPEDHNNSLIDIIVQHLTEVEQVALLQKKKAKTDVKYDEDPGWTVTATFMEWLRTIIVKKWDAKANVNKWSNVGASLMVFEQFYKKRKALNLRANMFYIPYLNECIDLVSAPVEFLKLDYQPNSVHLLDFPFLFPTDYLVAYFRTINFTSMFTHYEHSGRALYLQRAMEPFLKDRYWAAIRRQLKITLSDYLVLEIRRSHALEDTLNQLWGQEKRLLLKPLKVKMGMQEGEVGLDQGGVTYEFFRVVLDEAFRPDTGMFTIDSQTRMTWFHPASLERDWKYEMLGILFSLAVYNGITLPVTFPLAFYQHLLAPGSAYKPSELFSDIELLQDGWPTLAKSFRELLAWDDGDVSDVFLRDYSFSFEAFGRHFDIDMRKAVSDEPDETEENLVYFGPSKTSGVDSRETPLVNNANRDQFVKDYVCWLTFKSVAPQILAFKKGFLTCLHPKSLQLFDAVVLKRLVEGTQDIDISALRSATRYEDGYDAMHPTIVDFWSIVEKYDMEDRRRLLEFVTASERVPVTGFDSMNFYIVKGGADTEMLPTSSTCFGKLMLPEYKGREKLERKLGLAIRNSLGFGVV